ncbi:HelD family protein [Marinitenerispora sediminis]|uniref:AAA family ATPase n=1 Tax=Marinitenerispora sediminis TaxID=1931232 RepID=A0A368T979_9ACTN|nr:AAA family ATPase [Marinitenerispora sediminis]RCV54782.1 AAA family ATPase [Marinitenerispora sediminis]RCV60542.1 AAA family ATPase [Marinitenerispora sediminis]RCV61008.1 AAA family ATPase [Marinitenerispora sediminis]
MAEPSAAPEPDVEIRAERAHLAAARAALRDMRANVLGTETALGDIVGDKYTNEVLRRARARRAEELVDLPDVPLFFGRLDFEPGTVFDSDPAAGPPAGPDGDRVHIGRRHVHDAAGTPLVLDWRAPISVAFYRATPDDPMGVRSRRRYGFDARAELTAYEDESLTSAGEGPAEGGALLAAEIERPRSGPMRDIVATIQPEQDDLVRAPLEHTLCVQGAPGTGKTAVGLHRIAYLLYHQRKRLSRSGVAIIGPNRSFLAYIRNVLPALGEVDVTQTTVEDLLGHAEVRATDTPAAARVKGDARMAEVLRRDLWSLPAPPAEPLVVQRGSRRWRLYPDELGHLLTELRTRGVAYGSGRDLLAHRIAHAVLSRMEAAGETCDDRTHNQVRRDRAVRAAVNAAWPKADPVRLVFGLLTDPERLARAAEGLLTPDEQAAILLPGRPRGPKSARWSTADLALIDEAAGLIERPAGFGHIVLDEAQDLTPMQARAIARRAGTGSLTVLGDIAQTTVSAAPADWTALLAHLGRPEARLAVLDRGFRVPAQIIDFAARLLPVIAPGLGAPTAVRRTAGALRVTATEPHRHLDAVTDACARALRGQGSVGLIAADSDLPGLHGELTRAGLAPSLLGEDPDALEGARLVCVPASLAKGLEFDAVVAVEPARIAAAEERGLHRLYVVLTRAVSTLHVVHTQPLPEPLRAG